MKNPKKVFYVSLFLTLGLFFYAWAGGIHTHLPRGTGGGAYQDTVEIDAGDKLVAAHGEMDTTKGTIWMDAVDTELSPAFSAINSAFSSALSGYSLNVTGLNLNELTGGGETELHTHPGSGGGMANNDTTDTLLVNDFLRLDEDFYFPEQAFAQEQEYSDWGDGTTYQVNCLQVYDGVLYAGVNKGSPWGTLWQFTGEGAWTEFYNPGGGKGAVSMAVFKGKLYVGWTTGASGGGDISVWSGGSWSVALDSTFEDVNDLQVYGDSLYAGVGNGSNKGTVLSTVDGDTWQASLSGYDTALKATYALAVYQGKLYASISDVSAEGTSSLYEFNGATWSLIGIPAANHDILSMESYHGLLFMGMGNGANEGDLWTWDSRAFNEAKANSGADKRHINSMEVYNDKLYVGLGGPSVSNGKVYIVDGTRWRTTPIFSSGSENTIESMAIFGGKLFIGTGYGSGHGDLYEYYSGYRDGTPPLGLGEIIQHFAKKITFGDSSQFTGPVEIKGTLHVGFSGAETPQGGGPLIQFSVATSPQIAPVNSAILWAEALGAGDVELYAMDSGGNKASVTRNTQIYPAEMAVSDTRPYVTMTENIKTDIRTYMAMNRAMELLQQLARREGLLSKEEFIIRHVDRYNPGQLIQEKKQESFFQRFW